MAPRSLHGRLRWLKLKVTLAAWFVPPGARIFHNLAAEAADLMKATEENVRPGEKALHDG